MKLTIALLVLMVSLGAAQAAQSPKYTLYYLDKTRNVVSVGISADGKALNHPKKLTSKGGYDLFSVSPNGRYIVGFTYLSSEKYDVVLTTYKGFIDDLKSKPIKRTIFEKSITFDDTDFTEWPSKSNYFALSTGVFEVDVSVYNAKTGKIIVEHSATTPQISSDEKFIVWSSGITVKEIIDENLAGTSFEEIKDLKSNISNPIPSFSSLGNVWIGDTHKLAWVDSEGENEIWTADVVSDGKQIIMKNARMLPSKNASDLSYVSGKGLCFYEDKIAYCSPDLKTVKRTTMPSKLDDYVTKAALLHGQKNAINYQAAVSLDSKFVACPVARGKGKTPAIYLFNSAGQLHKIANGRHPEWKVVKSSDKSEDDF